MKRVQRLWHEIIQSRITLLLILLNITAFYVPWWFDNRAFDNLAKKSFLITWGGNIPALTFSGEYWRLLSSMFLHANFLHLACNMVALWSIGYLLEKRLYRIAFIGIYFCSGLAGSLLSAFIHSSSNIVSCGASGAILGLAGALIACLLFQGGETKKTITGLIVSILLTFGLGAALPVDNAAHAGGLFTGVIIGSLVLLIANKAGATRPWLAHILLVTLFCLPLTGMTYLYMQKVVPGGQAQIQSAKLIITLSNLGNGGSSSMVTGLHDMNLCIEEQFQEATPDWPACVQDQAYVPRKVMADLVTQEFNSCLANVEALRTAYAGLKDRKKLQTIQNYCTVRQNVYHALYNPPTVPTVSAAAWEKAKTEMTELARHIHPLAVEKAKQSWGYDVFFDEQEPEQDEIPREGVLNDIHPAVYKAVQDGQCPYYTCEKLH